MACQFRIHRQAEDAGRDLFGNSQRAFRNSEVPVSGLPVQWNRIVYSCIYAALLQFRLQSVTLSYSDNEQVPNCFRLRLNNRQSNAGIG